MPFGNSERSGLDEFWSLWQLHRSVDLEDSESRDVWIYKGKETEQPHIAVEARYYRYTPYVDTLTPTKPDQY